MKRLFLIFSLFLFIQSHALMAERYIGNQCNPYCGGECNCDPCYCQRGTCRPGNCDCFPSAPARETGCTLNVMTMTIPILMIVGASALILSISRNSSN